MRDARATPGNRGVLVLRRVTGERAEFLFVSLWESEEAIRAFSGDDLTRARYYAEDARYLIELPERVEHWELLSGAEPADAT